ncbi:hypothetical protein M5K25_000384 [Dendrobium thyrsiflorum]|uniref:AraC-type arabinose-binding/dimerisation domain-containing protein n=1 Tax=Dendrobium thyrsiflorum TaxID=117978 RepID=A0ABD0VTR8_DENTH
MESYNVVLSGAAKLRSAREWHLSTITLYYIMVGEWMMDPIKIPWFRHPGPSWSLVYLVKGGFNAIGEHTGAGHNCYIVVPFGGRTSRFRGPGVIIVYPAVPFGSKTAAWRGDGAVDAWRQSSAQGRGDGRSSVAGDGNGGIGSQSLQQI